jgi:uncharacterized protein with von Willebrand factor type A (vWA) domain
MTDEATARRLARLGRALRDGGVGVSLTDELDGARALALVDEGDREEVSRTLRIALKIPRPAWAAFDRLLAAIWAGGELRPVSDVVAAKRAGTLRGGRFPRWDAQRGIIAEDVDAPDGEAPGYSPHAQNRKRPLPDGSSIELRALERALAGWARRLATLRSRRFRPAPGRGLVDPRRSLRSAVRTGGELVSLAHRQRAREIPRLVFLCDTSGSMSSHTRFLLGLALAMKRVAPRTEVFAFNTALVRLTRSLTPAKIGLTLERLGAEVADWGGGTRIGESLEALLSDHRVIDDRAVVVILSDGLDRGEPERLREAMRQIHARARKVIWLNPLLRDPRYRPEAQGMQAALPFVDHFAAVHDAASLERLLPQLVA